MRRLLIIFAIAVLGLAYGSFNAAAMDAFDRAVVGFGSEGNPGMFCNISSAEVCVLAKDENDCKKLGGEKVENCPVSQSEE
ncbi:MAG: hypothetical protein AAF462_09800 [Thermodesulfobacteriota bacterium]